MYDNRYKFFMNPNGFSEIVYFVDIELYGLYATMSERLIKVASVKPESWDSHWV